MMDTPSGRALEQAPRWDLMDTEGYGGRNCVSVAPWMFLGYVGLYRRKKYVGGLPGADETGGAPYTLVAASAAS